MVQSDDVCCGMCLCCYVKQAGMVASLLVMYMCLCVQGTSGHFMAQK